MKKILLLSTVALASLASCSDYEDQFNLPSQLTDVKNGTSLVLGGSDYSAIANLSANKELALSLDPEGKTYADALAKLGDQKYFDNMITAEQFLPAYIANKFPQVDMGSRIRVTYNSYCGMSQYLSDFANLKSEYTLTKSDYKSVWGEVSTAKYLTPATVSKMNDVLSAAYPKAAAGDMAVVNYAYSEFEPSAGGATVIPNVYQKVTSFDAEGGNYVIAALADDGKYYPFGKLDDGKTYGYVMPSPITVGDNNVIATDEGESQVVTIEKSEKGYRLKNTNGQYLYMAGTYDSFNVNTTAPAEGADWTIASNGDGTFNFKNVLTGKSIKMNFYKEKYQFGSFADAKHTYMNEPMDKESTRFTMQNVLLPEGSTYVWKHDAERKYYKASSFVGGKNYASESWLVSDEIDFTKANKPVMNFDVAMNYLNEGKFTDHFALKVSDDYVDDVTTAKWTDLAFDNSGLGTSWTFKNISGLDLSAYKGKKIHIAFQYKGTDTCAPTVELKNVKIKEPNYWDVCLFKETPENEISTASLSRASRAAGDANATGLYVYDGTAKAWKAYSVKDDAAEVVVLQPEDYAQVGAEFIAKPILYLPTILQNKLPFANAGQKAVVIYNKAKETPAAVEYTYSKEGWAASKEYKTQTSVFLLTENGYVAQANTYLNETMLGDEGGFKAFDIALTGVTYVWKNDATYGWKASAFMKPTNYAAESWLVSSAINLTEAMDPVITFQEALNFLGGNKLEDFIQFKVSTDFDGEDVLGATWEDLELNADQRSTGDSWSFVTVGPCSLASYVGHNIHLAIRYKSTDVCAPTYEFKNIIITEKE